jgi:RNA polymerase subunit RPABC4/transcription elongation factor Spt4
VDAIATGIHDALAGLFGAPIVGVIFRVAGAYLILVWLAVALWAFVDTRRRTGTLAAAYGSAAFVILASPLLFPLAVIVLRIVRPHEFVSERRLSDVREAALESDLTAPRCPECRRVVEPDWLICPACRRPLGHRCGRCGRTVALDWPICAWCGVDLDHRRVPPELRVRA